jgi:hypothetical protein
VPVDQIATYKSNQLCLKNGKRIHTKWSII